MEKQELADAEFTSATIQRLLKAGKEVYTISENTYELSKIHTIKLKPQVGVVTLYLEPVFPVPTSKTYNIEDIDAGLVALKKLPSPFGHWVFASMWGIRRFLQNENAKNMQDKVSEEENLSNSLAEDEVFDEKQFDFFVSMLQKLLKKSNDVYYIRERKDRSISRGPLVHNYRVEPFTDVDLTYVGGLGQEKKEGWISLEKSGGTSIATLRNEDVADGSVVIGRIPGGGWGVAHSHVWERFKQHEEEIAAGKKQDSLEEMQEDKDFDSIYADTLKSMIERLRKAGKKFWLLDDEFYDSEKPITGLSVNPSSIDFFVEYNYPKGKAVKIRVYYEDMFSKMKLKKQPNDDYFVVIDNETR